MNVTIGNTTACKSCFKPTGLQDMRGPICKTCEPQYEADFKRIRQHLDKNPGSSKRDLVNYLGILPATINLYIDDDRMHYQPDARPVLTTSAKLSPTFEDRDHLVKLDINAKELLEQERPPQFFILMGGEHSSAQREPIYFRDMQPGQRGRVISGYVDNENPDLSDTVKRILKDGNKFAVYIDAGDHIIPAEVTYFSNRPVQIEMKPNQCRKKIERAPRVKREQPITIKTEEVTVQGKTYDISKTGISFTTQSVVAKAKDVLMIGQKQVQIVERKKYGAVYFYRGFYV